MSRPCFALLLLLGLASPGAAQAPSPAAWTLAIGDYTLYGRTTYTPTIILRPRIVYDTARGVDSARVVDSVRATGTLTPASRPASAPGRRMPIVPASCRQRCSRWIRGRS